MRILHVSLTTINSASFIAYLLWNFNAILKKHIFPKGRGWKGQVKNQENSFWRYIHFISICIISSRNPSEKEPTLCSKERETPRTERESRAWGTTASSNTAALLYNLYTLYRYIYSPCIFRWLSNKLLFSSVSRTLAGNGECFSRHCLVNIYISICIVVIVAHVLLLTLWKVFKANGVCIQGN